MAFRGMQTSLPGRRVADDEMASQPNISEVDDLALIKVNRVALRPQPSSAFNTCAAISPNLASASRSRNQAGQACASWREVRTLCSIPRLGLR